MNRVFKLTGGVLAAYLVVAFMHVWLNIGFDRLGLTGDDKQTSLRVGFLPVT